MESFDDFFGRAEPAERTGRRVVRLDARRVVRRLRAAPGDCTAIAAAIARRHRPGTVTLAVLNTVAAARQVHADGGRCSGF